MKGHSVCGGGRLWMTGERLCMMGGRLCMTGGRLRMRGERLCMTVEISDNGGIGNIAFLWQGKEELTN